MLLILACVVAACILIVGIVRLRRMRVQRELKLHSIEPEALYALLGTSKGIRIFDVRQPLDLLAYAEIIPGATRVPPKDVIENPMLIPIDEDAIVYCTCPGDKTSWEILRKARELKFTKLKLLRGGLAAWKAKGYPVERYDEPFHLDTAS